MYGDASPLQQNSYGSQAAEAWKAGNTGNDSVYVGIIDEGYQYTHPDLVDNAGTNPGETGFIGGFNIAPIASTTTATATSMTYTAGTSTGTTTPSTTARPTTTGPMSPAPSGPRVATPKVSPASCGT